MNESQIMHQSKAAYKQWHLQWREHAKIHSEIIKKSKNTLSDLELTGIGKAVLVVANGYSFEENIEIIKAKASNVDILCCDKTLGHLLDNGITPKYCLVCDANVSFDKYLDKWKDKVSKVTLITNVCANPRWTKEAQWKNIYFFINKDIINSQIEFSEISGCKDFIPAGTNVSNAMVVMLTQCDNNLRRNFFAYDKIILIGFDYSWKHGGKYYAFDQYGDGKTNYMCHSYPTAPSGAYLYTSGNLSFSASWLNNYVKTFNLPVVQCGPDSILQFGKTCDLEKQMSYRFREEDSRAVKNAANELKFLMRRKQEIENLIGQVGREHWMAHARTV